MKNFPSFKLIILHEFLGPKREVAKGITFVTRVTEVPTSLKS